MCVCVSVCVSVCKSVCVWECVSVCVNVWCKCVCVSVSVCSQENLAVVLREKKKTINIHCGPETLHLCKIKSFNQESKKGGANVEKAEGAWGRSGSAGPEAGLEAAGWARGRTLRAARTAFPRCVLRPACVAAGPGERGRDLAFPDDLLHSRHSELFRSFSSSRPQSSPE